MRIVKICKAVAVGLLFAGCASQGKKLEKALLTASELSQGPCRQAVNAAADICAPVIKGMLAK